MVGVCSIYARSITQEYADLRRLEGSNMAYQKTRKKVRKDAICRRMRDGKARLREARAIELGPRPTPFEPPKRRRIVVVIDLDFGLKVDVFRFFRTKRIDSYRVEHNGKPIEGRIGWANFCKRLSAHYPRILSPIA